MLTEKKRVVLNITATYCRTLFSIGCGLLAGRWTLMALGKVDYGLYGVVGGLTAFISFLNSLMAAAVGRFYAFSVGQAKSEGEQGMEICRKWFNTALLIHTSIPCLFMIIGYPIAEWTIRNWLVIPLNRIEACVTVLRCVSITCFVSMLNVPFSAMYTAKQYIAELTIYSIIQTAANVVFLYYMVSHPREWLTGYAVWCCILHVIPMTIISWRASVVFPECQFNKRYLFDIKRIKELSVFALYRLGGTLSDLLNQQGMSLLINKTLGPIRNTAMAIGNTVSGYTQTFAGSLSGAMYPVITNACGAGDYDKMRNWSFSACKYASLLSLIFALPLSLEIHEVMVLWLREPPIEAAELCLCLLFRFVFENMTCGHYMAIISIGDIRKYQIAIMFAGVFLIIPVAWAGLQIWSSLLVVGLSLAFHRIVTVIIRLHYGRMITGMSPWHWIRKILIPIVIASILSLLAGMLIKYVMSASFWRVCVVTFVVESVFLPIIWMTLFTIEERRFFINTTIGKYIKLFRYDK